MLTTRASRTVVLTAVLLSTFLLFPRESEAQRRGGGARVRAVPGRAVVLRAYYGPRFYNPWYSPYWYGYAWPPLFAYGQPYGYGYGYEPESSMRLEVSPRETEVFVDGYYAGTVDDFDGFFQRLRLEPGEHQVTLYLSGNRTATQMIYLQPGRTFRIRHTMEALPAGAPAEPRPASPGPLPRRAGPPPSTPPPGPPREQGPPARGATVGSLAIRVQPEGAAILIDGERWEGPAPSEQLVVQLNAGVHRIEIQREGYRSYSSEIEVRPGETATVNVSLSRQ